MNNQTLLLVQDRIKDKINELDTQLEGRKVSKIDNSRYIGKRLAFNEVIALLMRIDAEIKDVLRDQSSKIRK
jgi:hypothetical protein